MSIVTANLAMSLDGCTAGPHQSREHPFGTGADALTAWMFETEQPGRGQDAQLLTDGLMGAGAAVPRTGPLEMRGGTTFTFVTGGLETALEQARKAAGERDVEIAGGASPVRQYLAAGLLDALVLHLVPVVLGAGERLFEGLAQLALTPVEVISSPTVTHLRYRTARRD
ncbi:dihydrofolate reductase family protein [Streptomyces sp. NPDC005402]|uniref:dihydrofolate reductase family protein n=1 Tax=Streptomyces sp. NPDC005402 TaxID=3155338 RepID=UPI0033BDE9E1